MLKRLTTGIIYLLILLAFFAMRVLLRDYFFHPLVFDGVIVLFSIIGTFEMCRAFGDKLDRVQKTIVQIFATAVIICYAVSDILYKYKRQTDLTIVNYSPNFAFVVFMAGAAVLVSLLVFRHEKTSMESLGYSFLAYIYPSVFLVVLSGVNHMPLFSEIGILFVFVICPFADCFAFVFGMTLRRFLPMKMAPNVSPNKTLIGGFGGLLGGAIGAVCLFFVYYGLFQTADFNSLWTNLMFFIALGVLTAAFAELGDLVESAIKRKLGLKDMGRILPGHGGILDRIDSSLFAALIVCFVLVLRIMITG